MTQQGWWIRVLTVVVLIGLWFGNAPLAQTQAQQKLTPVVGHSLYNDTSPALRDMLQSAPVQAQAAPVMALPVGQLPRAARAPVSDPAVQTQQYSQAATTLVADFEGNANSQFVLPPDTNGDIGYDPATGKKYYFQTVNYSYRFWDVTDPTKPTPVTPVTLNKSFWIGAGGFCETHDDGDPVALYDPLAHRWLFSQFAVNTPTGPFYQCIAISATADPLGAWYRYSYLMPDTDMNDYPKFGVWPDAYYMTDHQFQNGVWDGAGVFAYDRAKMLAGLPADFIYFNLKNISIDLAGHLPADFDGLYPPPPGAPGLFAELDNGIPADGAAYLLRIWEFHTDFTHPEDATFGSTTSGDWALANYKLAVDPFTYLPDNPGNLVPQKDTGRLLDAIGDRLMFRLAYRNLGSRQVLVGNQTVDAGGKRAGIRWFELQNSGSGWSIRQQGTFAPPDGNYRWMGSIASDAKGDLALGYSVSSGSMYPSIYITGRLVNDTLGAMTLGETPLVNGGGSQTASYQRWGDYSSMSVDPVDDCTFWYTNEYYATTSSWNWQTRIEAFRFPGCNAPASGTLSGAITNSTGGAPVAGAVVTAGTLSATSGADGKYALALPLATYSVTAQANGFITATASNVDIPSSKTVTKNFALTPRTAASVHGVVKDASGHGYPLYTRLDIASVGYSASVFTNPQSGAYQVSLFQGEDYTIKVNVVGLPGYLAQTVTYTPTSASATRDFLMGVDSTCTTPGYFNTGSACNPIPGGLATGFVTDQNTGSGVNGATLTGDTAGTATSFATPFDDAIGDGLYFIFQGTANNTTPETHTLTASKTGGYMQPHYAQIAHVVNYLPDKVVTQNFALPTGKLTIAPSSLEVSVPHGKTATPMIIITNTGTAVANYVLQPLFQAMLQPGSFDPPFNPIEPADQGEQDSADLGLPAAPDYPSFSAGPVLQSWSTGLASAWGIAADASGQVWVSSPAPAWGGDSTLHAFSQQGAPTGVSYPYPWNPGNGPADLAFNVRRGTFWTVNIAEGDNCIYEMSPDGGFSGGRICPGGENGFIATQRGLAYDPTTDTYYAGSWNDLSITQFRPDGVLLRRRYVGLAISGLAYNPDTHHLFVMVNAAVTKVYVLDTANDFAPVGAFTIGADLMGAFSGAGLEMACDGSLWLADQSNGTVYNVASGENTSLCTQIAGWFYINNNYATLQPGDHQDVYVTFTTVGFPAGTYHGQIVVQNDTPYTIPNLQVTLHNVAIFLPGIFR